MVYMRVYQCACISHCHSVDLCCDSVLHSTCVRTYIQYACLCVSVLFLRVLFASACFGACKREMYDNSQRYKEGNKRAIMKFGEENERLRD